MKVAHTKNDKGQTIINYLMLHSFYNLFDIIVGAKGRQTEKIERGSIASADDV